MPRPPTLTRGIVTLRPLRRRDEGRWIELRRQNRAWLKPWEANSPPGRVEPPVAFAAYVRSEHRRWKDRTAFSMAIVVDGLLVGRVSIHAIEWGAQCSGSIGYWISSDYAGRRIVPNAVALLSDYGFSQGLHRLEIALRPENERSLSVARGVGFREEGLRSKYLYIDGDWRDHVIFALNEDEPRNGPYWSASS